MAKQKFQLRPKHLITATLSVCVLAIVALIIGVVGTFKPRDRERRQEEQTQKQQRETNHVEVWKPNRNNSQEAVILNPDAPNTSRRQPAGQTAADDSDEQAARNPFSDSRVESRETQEQPRRARQRTDSGSNRARPAENQPAQPAPSLQSPAVAFPSRPVGQPVPAQPRSEQQPEPKAEPRPAPVQQPKPQQKEVIDNLF
ncbi:hypothetical protein [Neisseria iguanae]|uniref:Uncharacterized protein n=1 Tax=Neisseria iguanae TaxID=90242 RepID=A0A2P7U0I4_9NEIS|nr:hypothetical protein [Neisseria iguanae]PSJ80486.1 hypothetical protein C7N83_05960 [Neisseria iguanae]